MKLKFPLTVYRGEHGKASPKKRLSWSLDRKKAEWFACRYMGKKTPGRRILKLEVPSLEYVIGYHTDRGEDEVVVHPRLFNVKIKPEVIG